MKWVEAAFCLSACFASATWHFGVHCNLCSFTFLLSVHLIAFPQLTIRMDITGTNSVAWVRERTIPTERPLLFAKLVPTFADRGCHVVSVTDPYGRNFGFLDRSRYFFFQVAPQLYSWGEWTPFQTHYFSENMTALGIEPGPLTTRPQRRSTFFYITYINSVRTSQESQYISVV
jgi:hypothetical protein